MADDAPDYTNLETSLGIALRAAGTDSSEVSRMLDFMHATAHKSPKTWRPFAAAASFIGSDPYGLVKAEDGVTFNSVATVVVELNARQNALDVELGLLPKQNTSAFIFAGVAR